MDETTVDRSYVSPPNGFSSAREAARDALNWILKRSIESRKEWGGVICEQRGRFHAMPPRTQGYGNTVDVGVHEPNKSCPAGARPVAYYHTHPIFSAGGLTGDYNHFSGADEDVARDHGLDAYLGTLDGSFLKFDRRKPGVPIHLDGKLHNSASIRPHPRQRDEPGRKHPVRVLPIR